MDNMSTQKRPRRRPWFHKRSKTAPNTSTPPQSTLNVTQLGANTHNTHSPEGYHDWIADTGATSHMTPHRHWFNTYEPCVVPIKLADNSIVYSAGVGTVIFMPVLKGQATRHMEFTKVLHVPQLRNNLLSVLFLTRQRKFVVKITANSMDFMLNGKTLFKASITQNHHAFLDGNTQATSANISSTLPLDYTLWHRRFAHVNHKDVKQLINKDMVTGIKLDSKVAPDPICEPCLAGKMHADPFPSTGHRTTKPLELIHMDVHGPIPVQSHSGFKWWIYFQDDHTKFNAAIPMHKKSDAFASFLRFKALAENQTGHTIKATQDDKGGEFMSKEFEEYCNNNGIERRHSARNRPQQNGSAERGNRVCGERITSMLSEANLPMQFWAEALAAVIHVWNRCPTAALKGKTPHEMWYKEKPDVSHLRVWGCLSYVHIQKDKRVGLSPHMEKGVFIGYPAGYKGWKFYIPSTKRTVISERADFDERYFPGLKTESMASLPNTYLPPVAPPPLVELPDLGGDDQIPDIPDPAPLQVAPAPMPEPPIIIPDVLDVPIIIPDVPDVPIQPPVLAPAPAIIPAAPAPVQPPIPIPAPIQPPPAPPVRPAPPPIIPEAPRRSTRVSKQPGEWWKVRQPEPHFNEEDSDEEAVNFTVIDIEPDWDWDMEFAGAADPANYKQAMKTPEAEHWKQAMLEEINAHLQNGTWEIVPRPEKDTGKKTIGSGWVFKIKRTEDGSIERFKGRFVAKGYSQRPGFDYVEVFAPTVRMSTVRLVVAISAIEGLHLHTVDISHAFIKGDLDEEIYMEQPEGFQQHGPEYVCRLRKSIYGLKQAARQWNKKLHDTLQDMGFKRIESDRSVYVYSKDGVRIIIPIFVDDITLAGKSKKAIDETIAELSRRFKLRDLGPTSFLLGIHITRDWDKHTISLSQRQYVVDMLEKFNHGNCSPVQTPMEPGLRLSASMGATTEEDKALMATVPYLSAVGAMMYLACTTRPDIANAVGVLARFSANPGPAHWKAVKHLFRYLQGTKDLKLVYGPDPDSNEQFTSFTDSSHGDNLDNGRSTGGYLVKYGTGAISWSSKLQSVVALSTSEAEFIAAVEAGKEIIWMRKILGEFGYTISGPSILRCDNQSSIQVAKNPEHHGRMKHLDLRFFWLRDQVENGEIGITYLPTAEMPADCLTKPLSREKVVHCRRLMGFNA